jgi:hypothetical protein
MTHLPNLTTAAALAVTAIGCSDPPPADRPDGGTTPSACRATIEAKIAEAEADGVSIEEWPVADSETMDPANAGDADIATSDYNQYYRDDLANHPGCTTWDLYYDKGNPLPYDPENGTFGYDSATKGNNDFFWQDRDVNPTFGVTNVIDPALLPDGDVARIPGYPCAAKEYVTPDEDKRKPVVILVHGNSVRPHTWEEFELDPAELDPDGTVTAANGLTFTPQPATEQLVSKLVAEGYRVIAFDARSDRVATFEAELNPARNLSHGWAVPMLQALFAAVIAQNLADEARTEKRIAIVTHSFGGMAAYDALRRMWLASREPGATVPNPFQYVSHVVFGSAGHHGVLTYDQGSNGEPPGYCDTARPSMRGWATCEYGSLLAYTPTYFTDPLNGYKDLFATACADGDFAFGQREACGGNAVAYSNVYMEDPDEGQVGLDGFLNASSMTLDMPGCVENRPISTDSFDWSAYFWKGILAAHLGSIRSAEGMQIILEELRR